jgi:hypothetical protein
MDAHPSLDMLWDEAPRGGPPFRPQQVTHLPAPARRYLRHAIATDAPLASAVRLRMHGELKLGCWFPFEAEQVIAWNRGMIWQATVRPFGVPIRGFDRVVDGRGAQQWKVLGWIPIVSAAGPDIARSTAGRMAAESMWLPSVLVGPSAQWSFDGDRPTVEVCAQERTFRLTLQVDEDGRLQSLSMMRWGETDDGTFTARPFGARIEAERTFDGYTIPAQVRVGWHTHTDRAASGGEFFRGTIDAATFR